MSDPHPVRIVVLGEPVAKGRPRVFRSGTTITPKKTERWENNARLVAQIAMQGRKPLTGAIRVSVHAYWSTPTTWAKWLKEFADTESVWHTGKPDGDNVLKAAMDAMEGIVYQGDAQVCSASVYKRYSNEPRVEITVVELGGITKHSKRGEYAAA